jgi:hypothetical protein
MVKILVSEITASKTMAGSKPDQPIHFDSGILIKTNQADNCLRSLQRLFYQGGWQG